MPGGGGQCLTPKSFSSREAARRIFWPSRGSGGFSPQKIFKIKGLGLDKNAFPEISA